MNQIYFSIFFINCLFLLQSSCSILEAYKLSDWKEDNLNLIEFQIQKQNSSQFSINVTIPLLWEDTKIGISIYLVDKSEDKINSVDFIQNTNKNDKLEYNAELTLSEFLAIDCVKSFLDSEETIVRAQCQTYIEFNDKTQITTALNETKRTIYMIIKYSFSIQYSLIASAIFNGIPLQEQKDCPCCETNCIEDPSIPQINQIIDTNQTGDLNETEETIRIDTVTEDSQISYEFDSNSNLLRALVSSDEELSLTKIYVENSNYQADLTNYVNITKKEGKVVMNTGLLTPVQSIGKYFGFRFILTNNEKDSTGKYKVKILKSKIFVINDLKINYQDIIDTNDEDLDEGSSNYKKILLICSIILGIVIIIIIVCFLVIKQMHRKANFKVRNQPDPAYVKTPKDNNIIDQTNKKFEEKCQCQSEVEQEQQPGYVNELQSNIQLEQRLNASN